MPWETVFLPVVVWSARALRACLVLCVPATVSKLDSACLQLCQNGPVSLSCLQSIKYTHTDLVFTLSISGENSSPKPLMNYRIHCNRVRMVEFLSPTPVSRVSRFLDVYTHRSSFLPFLSVGRGWGRTHPQTLQSVESVSQNNISSVRVLAQSHLLVFTPETWVNCNILEEQERDRALVVIQQERDREHRQGQLYDQARVQHR